MNRKQTKGEARKKLHEATGTLLDLSLESVVSAEEAEIEDLQEMEKQIIDQFRNRSTHTFTFTATH